MVVPINCDLLLAFAMWYRIGATNFYFSGIRDGPKQCPDDSGLFVLPPKIMIKDREKGDRMNGNRRDLSPENINFINTVERTKLCTHAWLGVELNACW